MSVLGDAVRNNKELHNAIYKIIAYLAAQHIVNTSMFRGPSNDWLCELAAKVLPHLPPPPKE